MEELEFKWQVQEDTFGRLYELLEAKSSAECERIMQINYYYDTEFLHFNAIGETVRIRQIGTRLTGTAKLHSKKDGSVPNTERSFSVGCLTKTMRYKSEEVFLQGELVTERTAVSPEENITVCFDKNYYLGTVDYEIELEYTLALPSQANKWYKFISEIIRGREGELKRSSSKSNRFFEKKKALRI